VRRVHDDIVIGRRLLGQLVLQGDMMRQESRELRRIGVVVRFQVGRVALCLREPSEVRCGRQEDTDKHEDRERRKELHGSLTFFGLFQVRQCECHGIGYLEGANNGHGSTDLDLFE
jgi:hypothetical protein